MQISPTWKADDLWNTQSQGLKIKALLSFKGLALCESEAREHYCPSKVGEGRGYNPSNS